MVDMKTETRSQHEQKPVNPRDAIREQRQRRLRIINSGKTPTIKVYAANETMRGALRHPSGARFRTNIDQPVEWPNDTFTARRIAEGSVRTDGPGSGEMPEPDGSLNPRQQSAALTAARGTVGQLRLTSLSPNTAVSGSADVVMSCIGTGFTPNTVIKFGDYDEPTTFVSPTEVTTGVKPSLFQPAAVPVSVREATVSSESLDFTFTAPEQAKNAKPSKQPPSEPPQPAA